LGKLDIGTTTEQLFQEVEDSPIKIIYLKPDYIFQIERLPFHHKDPFDRLLISTAQIEKLKIISIDVVFDKYSVTRIWD
jgi:PIN domain nuclease of toxin-antitoxin system